MIIISFLMAIVFIVLGHFYKAKRWNLFISVYEQIPFYNILYILSVGHLLNAILPIRIGDLYRIVYSGKKLSNGHSLSIATVFVDIFIDFITVGIIFTFLLLIKKGGEQLQTIAYIYIFGILIIIPLTIVGVVFRKRIKKLILLFAGIFNDKIEFRILYVSYCIIAILKDLVKKINKVKFCIYSITMWCGYILSYLLFAEVVQHFGFNYSASNIFTTLFSGLTLYRIDKNFILIWIIYLIVPLLICLFIASVFNKNYNKNYKNILSLLPQMNTIDRMAFLKTYYQEENREHIQMYLDINSDIQIIEDSSAGSNASTIVIIKNDRIYYRKYAFDDDGKKLAEQIEWIENHQKNIPLPIIANKVIYDTYCMYDMYSYNSAIGMFRFIHTDSIDDCWRLLSKILTDIKMNLHVINRRNADICDIKDYINTKIYRNLNYIKENSKQIKNLEKYEYIYVNGKKINTLGHYDKLFDFSYLIDVFKDDICCDIHGDLTIENLICIKNSLEIDATKYVEKVIPQEYYFIDPNTNNMLNSMYLDYAKLLQSLHGNYEFLMMVNSVEIADDEIRYLATKSEVYSFLFLQYKKWLEKTYNKNELRSIYFHEVVHWLRLMPYKIRKDDKLSVVFYTGLLQVLNDVKEMFFYEE